MKALKLNMLGLDKSEDNIETIGALDILKEWAESLEMPWNDGRIDTDELEFISRDGFSAHNHNRGGIDLINITNRNYLMGSGEYRSLAIKDKVQDSYDEDYATIEKENPTLTQDEIYEELDGNSNEYDDIAWRVRVMYEGGGLIMIYVGYDFDAPYFRFRGSPTKEFKIEFKSLNGLKMKLKNIKNKVEKSI